MNIEEYNQLQEKLEKLREEYKNAGGVEREILIRRARALKLAMGEK